MHSIDENSVKTPNSSLDRNELILHSAGEGICGIDLDGNISFANPAAIEILGWSGESFVGSPYYQVFFSFTKDQIDDLVCTPIQFALLDGESSQVSSETFHEKDGTPILVEYICVPLKTNNETIGAVVTFQDINERVDIEAAVAEARESALESARTKMAFLANMSHEIRTPLNGIIGMSALLSNTPLQPEQLHYTNVIKESAEFLLGIVNEILDFSKIEAGKLKLETFEFNLRELLNGIISFFKPEANKKGLSLSLQFADTDIFEVVGDSTRLRQVLNNLLTNAIKFTENGEVILDVTTEKRPDSLFVTFKVIDSGIGISDDRRIFLFEPFSQADISTTRKFGGTGLGLAISKQIVAMMGGEIGLERDTQIGSVFWFCVPFHLANHEFRTKNESSTSKPQKPTQEYLQEIGNDYSHFQILVAEDNEINKQVVDGILGTFSVKADFAKNGFDAVKMCQLKEYDLILMDCQMPEMDGFDATREIRRNGKANRKTPIVAMTASVLAIEREKCLESGMDGFIGKPFSRNDIEKILSKYLSSKTKKLDSNTSFVQHCLSEILEENALASLVSIEERGEANFVRNTLDLYFEQAEKTIAEIKRSLDEDNSSELQKLAHFLRGSSGSIGLLVICRLCTDLERASLVENSAKLRQIFETIEMEYDISKKAIKALL